MYDLIIEYPITIAIFLVALLLWFFNTLNDSIKKDNPKGYAIAIGGTLLMVAFVIWMLMEAIQDFRA